MLQRASVLVLSILIFLPSCSEPLALNRVLEAPEVEITSPSVATQFRQGLDIISFEGVVTDERDDPSELVVSWEIGNEIQQQVVADEEGFVQLLVAAIDLTEGPLDVRLSARDRDDLLGDARTSIEVRGAGLPPQVQINTPGDGTLFDPGLPVPFEGRATDDFTPAAELTIRWLANGTELGGVVSTDGVTAVVAETLPEGEVEITLEATDADGLIGTDAIVIEIGAPPPPEPIDAQPGDLMFSEMMVNPEAVADQLGEWVELYNRSGYFIDAGGYTFHDDDYDSWVLAGPLVVAPGDYLVLCAELDPIINGGVPCDGWFLRDFAGEGLALANVADELVLSRPDGLEIDWLHYDETWWSPGIAIGVDERWLTEEAANDTLDRWCDQDTAFSSTGEFGTPGSANTPCF